MSGLSPREGVNVAPRKRIAGRPIRNLRLCDNEHVERGGEHQARGLAGGAAASPCQCSPGRSARRLDVRRTERCGRLAQVAYQRRGALGVALRARSYRADVEFVFGAAEIVGEAMASEEQELFE